MSKQTATASTIQITTTAPVLMLAMELGEEHWKLGFSSAFGQEPLVRDIGSRDRKVLLAHVAWAKKKLGLWIKSLLANNGLTLVSWKDLPGQLSRLRLWNGKDLPSSLRSRLERYAQDYAYYTERIRELETERRRTEWGSR